MSDLYSTGYLIDRLAARGLVTSALPNGQVELEYAYEALLRGNAADAARRLARLLNPNGGCDAIRARVDADLSAAPRKEKAA